MPVGILDLLLCRVRNLENQLADKHGTLFRQGRRLFFLNLIIETEFSQCIPGVLNRLL
jgi:hypothetical protein